MLPQLDAIEARVIGCLIEKSIVTPDQYPLTLNALTNACNQKSSRDPVMSLTQGEIQHAIRMLSRVGLGQGPAYSACAREPVGRNPPLSEQTFTAADKPSVTSSATNKSMHLV